MKDRKTLGCKDLELEILAKTRFLKANFKKYIILLIFEGAVELNKTNMQLKNIPFS